jgi:diadenosine tetraphosphatase ApaH/serine/threonine PP2A family protein phosphatase
MTYGLISDIHGNLEALDAVLGELRGAEAFLCMGDIVGYGADPGACMDRVRELPNLICVAGNHDLAAVGKYDLGWFNPFAGAAIVWTADQLSEGHKSFLTSLPMKAHVERALLVHGSLPNEMEYITSIREAKDCFDAMPGDLTFIGHTHITEYYRVRATARFPEQVPLRSGGTIETSGDDRHIVNPGAIGQPRDGNADASYGIWDPDSSTVEVRRVCYDIAAAQAKMRAARLPDALSERLSAGH